MNKWRLSCLTFNVNAQKAVAGPIYKLFDEEEFASADLIFVGLQEVSHSEIFGNAFIDTSWVTVIASWMYVNQKILLFKTSLATNILLVFARLQRFIAFERVDSRLSRTTFSGLTGHKGTISVRIKLKNGHGLVFINSHMVPHTEGYVKRCLQFESSKTCAFEDEEIASTSYSSIWLGDMNWRVDHLTALEMDAKLREVQHDSEIESLVETVDQLRKAKRRQEAFLGYREEPIYFTPTYRLVVGSRVYDLLRVPSWCDRILCRGDSLRCEVYRSNQNMTISDHFPVVGVFSYELSGDCFAWSVAFERLPNWSSVVSVFCRFSFLDGFFETDGTYRDWLGIYPEFLTDPSAPVTWIYFLTCYKLNERADSVFVGEFPCVSPGSYRFGYFSIKRNTLQGISEPFVVT